MLSFSEANKLFQADRLRELADTASGRRFLKLRSLSRKEFMSRLIEKHSIDVGGANSRDWLKILYNSDLTADAVDEAIKELYEKERSARRANEDFIVSELYKIQSFEWGGLHQNSLEKTIVDRYVKKITSFDSLNSAIENDIHNSMRAYVLASWYNHWSSIIIEDIFKDHPYVIPAIGLIKKVDFFVNDKPFDLKTTYLPEGFIKEQRRLRNLRPELTLMKKMARELRIGFDKTAPDAALVPDLWQKLDDHPDSRASDLVSELQSLREELLDQCIEKPKILVRWLYENQGIRRFDASNRLFLVLVDRSNFFASWKLKRAKPLIEEKVNAYLDETKGDIGFELHFDWNATRFTSEAALIFVSK